MHRENRDRDNGGRIVDEKDYVIEEVPVRHSDVLSKKATTIRTATDEITTEMPMIGENTNTERLELSQFSF